jgi:hypothetical protein
MFTDPSSADLPVNTLQNVLGAVENKLTCALCKESCKNRIKQVLYQWTLAPVSGAGTFFQP